MSSCLVDPYKRVINYLRVSITDLCNLRCVYCRPPEGVKLVSHHDILTYEEILTIISLVRDMGIRKIRITGGEPLVRRGVLEFLARLIEIDGIADVGLTTNGILLGHYAADLKAAGLTRVNVSLDSMRRDVFASITGSDCLDKVLDSIERALEVGLDPVKINVVLLKGINEKDVPDFARMTISMPVQVRFIERMPFGTNPVENPPDSFSALQALEIIRSEVGEIYPIDRGPMEGPATLFKLKGAKGIIGIIDPVTGHFCGSCNRLRLTARGTLRPCLLSSKEIDIKSALRQGASREDLARIIMKAVLAKPVGQTAGRLHINEGMNMIGG